MNHDLSANSLALSALAVLAAYLVGSIPFGYLIAYWSQGDRHPHGRLGQPGRDQCRADPGVSLFPPGLRARHAQGISADAGLSLARRAGSPARVRPTCPSLVALAAILGHTFPVYLKFRGGKGVATSVGAVLALDPVSCAVVGRGLWGVAGPDTLRLAGVARGRAGVRGGAFRARGLTIKS